MREKVCRETKRKLQVRVKEHQSETEKVSKGTKYSIDKKKLSQTEMWGSAITDHANARKSSYRQGKRTNHRERER